MAGSQHQKELFMSLPCEIRVMVYDLVLDEIVEAMAARSQQGMVISYPTISCARASLTNNLWDSGLVLQQSRSRTSRNTVNDESRKMRFSVYDRRSRNNNANRSRNLGSRAAVDATSSFGTGTASDAPLRISALALTSRKIYMEMMHEYHQHTTLICRSALDLVDNFSRLRTCGTLQVVRSIRIDFCFFGSPFKTPRMSQLIRPEFFNWDKFLWAVKPNFLRAACPFLEEVTIWFDTWDLREPAAHSYPRGVKELIGDMLVPKISGCKVQKAVVRGIYDKRLAKKLEMALTDAEATEA